MEIDVPIVELVTRWEKIPLPANLDDIDPETFMRIMERLELAYLEGERELNRLN